MEKRPTEIKQPSTLWLVLGFVFGVLGGFLGLLIGGHFAFGPYDQRTRRIGRIMMAVGAAGLLLWKFVKYV